MFKEEDSLVDKMGNPCPQIAYSLIRETNCEICYVLSHQALILSPK